MSIVFAETATNIGSSAADVWVAIATGVLALASIVAVVLAPHQIQEARLTRRGQQALALYAEWGSPLMLEARIRLRSLNSQELLDIMKSSINEPGESAFVLLRVPNFFETVAALVNLGAIEEDLVRRIYGSDIRRYWNVWEPVFGFLRAEHDQSTM